MNFSIKDFWGILLTPIDTFKLINLSRKPAIALIIILLVLNSVNAFLQFQGFRITANLIRADIQVQDPDVPVIEVDPNELSNGTFFDEPMTKLSELAIEPRVLPSLFTYLMYWVVYPILLLLLASFIGSKIFSSDQFSSKNLFFMLSWSLPPAIILSIFQLVLSLSMLLVPQIGPMMLSRQLFTFPYWQVGQTLSFSYILKDLVTYYQSIISNLAILWQIGLVYLFVGVISLAKWFQKLIAILGVFLITSFSLFVFLLLALNLVFFLTPQ